MMSLVYFTKRLMKERGWDTDPSYFQSMNDINYRRSSVIAKSRSASPTLNTDIWF